MSIIVNADSILCSFDKALLSLWHDVENYFLKKFKIKLHRRLSGHNLRTVYYEDDVYWGWDKIEFENEAAFVLFMLEWS